MAGIYTIGSDDAGYTRRATVSCIPERRAILEDCFGDTVIHSLRKPAGAGEKMAQCRRGTSLVGFVVGARCVFCSSGFLYHSAIWFELG